MIRRASGGRSASHPILELMVHLHLEAMAFICGELMFDGRHLGAGAAASEALRLARRIPALRVNLTLLG